MARLAEAVDGCLRGGTVSLAPAPAGTPTPSRPVRSGRLPAWSAGQSSRTAGVRPETSFPSLSGPDRECQGRRRTGGVSGRVAIPWRSARAPAGASPSGNLQSPPPSSPFLNGARACAGHRKRTLNAMGSAELRSGRQGESAIGGGPGRRQSVETRRGNRLGYRRGRPLVSPPSSFPSLPSESVPGRGWASGARFARRARTRLRRHGDEVGASPRAWGRDLGKQDLRVGVAQGFRRSGLGIGRERKTGGSCREGESREAKALLQGEPGSEGGKTGRPPRASCAHWVGVEDR